LARPLFPITYQVFLPSQNDPEDHGVSLDYLDRVRPSPVLFAALLPPTCTVSLKLPLLHRIASELNHSPRAIEKETALLFALYPSPRVVSRLFLSSVRALFQGLFFSLRM